MLQIGSPDPGGVVDGVDTPGGFAWWYCDLLDEEGSGLVLIWAFALPFLPGLASSARAGDLVRARRRPALNLAVYQRGRQVAYALHELPAEACHWDGSGRWRFGRSTAVLVDDLDGRSLGVHLDLDGPRGEPIRGQVTLRGPARRGGEDRRVGVHEWSPLVGPAWGEAALSFGDEIFRISGPAYLDRNAGAVPLDAMGIGKWAWGRAVLPAHTRIWYVLWPENGGPPQVEGLTIDRDGAAVREQRLAIDAVGWSTGWWGMPGLARLRLTRDGRPWIDARRTAPLEDGPFYTREAMRMIDGEGCQALGTAEVCVPSRVDAAWSRPLVRMCVQGAAGGDSIWLPLFAGARRGRVQRLLFPPTPRLAGA